MMLLIVAWLFAAWSPQQGPPPQGPPTRPSPQLVEASYEEVAIALANRPSIDGISLDADGSRTHGVMFDRVLAGAVRIRADIAAGRQPAVSGARPGALVPLRFIIVAYPSTAVCAGKPALPTAIQFVEHSGLMSGPVPHLDPVRGDAIATLLPGVAVPDGSLAMEFSNAPINDAEVRITYDPTCPDARAVTLPIRLAAPARRIAGAAVGTLPDPSMPATTVHVNAMISGDGAAVRPTMLDGPPELRQAAADLVASWKFEPARLNGSGTPIDMIFTIPFTASGAPTSAGVGAGGRSGAPMPIGAGVPPGVRSDPMPRPAATRMTPFPRSPELIEVDKLAREAAANPDLDGIPLDATGDRARGEIFDTFLLGALNARRQTATIGATPPASLFSNRIMVIAFPMTCQGQTVAPIGVELTDASGKRAAPQGSPMRDAELVSQLPGVRVSSDAIGVMFPNIGLRGASVRISYGAAACSDTSATLELRGERAAVQATSHVSVAKFPDGVASSAAATVLVQGIVDADGVLKGGGALDGPPELEAAAVAAAAQWKFDPIRVNGVVQPGVVAVPITFTANGDPSGARFSNRLAPTGLDVTVNGEALTHENATGDVAMVFPGGVRPPTYGACLVADDPTYGVTMEHPVKTGGGSTVGPSREVKFISALRGPDGQGIHYRRLGDLHVGSADAIVDAYELTYAGLGRSLRIYVDEYHWDEPRAPRGLVCGAPIGLAK